jgi:hypothetical protein
VSDRQWRRRIDEWELSSRKLREEDEADALVWRSGEKTWGRVHLLWMMDDGR